MESNYVCLVLNHKSCNVVLNLKHMYEISTCDILKSLRAFSGLKIFKKTTELSATNLQPLRNEKKSECKKYI